MKEQIQAFINGLIIYDYILFGAVLVLFILFLILTIILREKLALALTLLLLSFSILVIGPTVGYIYMHSYLFKNSTSITTQKRLTYTEAVVVYGKLTNESKFNFESCKISASANKISGNAIKDYIHSFVPFIKMSTFENNISIGEVREFKVIIEPFIYANDYNISIGAKCR